MALRPAQARGRLECRPGLALLELGAPDIPVHPLTPLKVSRYSNSALLNICRMYTDPRTKRNYKGQEAIPKRVSDMNLKSDRR